MSDTRQEETQQELFGEFSPQPKRAERLPALARSQKAILLNTNIEQIILASIILVLLLCFVFFLGLLRGKSISQPTKMTPAIAAPVNRVSVTAAAVTAPRTTNQTKVITSSTLSPVKPKIDPSKPYTIQLITYKRQELAEQDVAYLRSKGYYSMIIPSGDYFQVCVGQYASKEEAKTDIKRFKARYKDVFLRRR